MWLPKVWSWTWRSCQNFEDQKFTKGSLCLTFSKGCQKWHTFKVRKFWDPIQKRNLDHFTKLGNRVKLKIKLKHKWVEWVWRAHMKAPNYLNFSSEFWHMVQAKIWLGHNNKTPYYHNTFCQIIAIFSMMLVYLN